MGADQPSQERDELQERVEGWFVRQGCPHLKDHYTPDMSFPWAGPLLAFVFLAEVTTAPKGAWPLWLNVLAIVGGTVVLLAFWIVIQVLIRRATTWSTGQRLLALPTRIGWVEVGVFLLGPPLVPLIFGQQVGSAAAVLVGNLVLLAAIYVGTSYALLHLALWAIPKAFKELRSITKLLVRALPLLLLITIVLFINAEVWQVAAGVDKPSFAAALGLLFAVGLGFLRVRLPLEIESRATFTEAGDVVKLVTPVEGLGEGLASAMDDKDEWLRDGQPKLTSNQVRNLSLVALVSQSLPVAMTAVVMGGFFVALGLLLVPSGVVTEWTGSPPDVLGHVELLGQPLELSWELLLVSAFLAAFSGLYFTVVLMTDQTYRDEFLADILAEVRQTLAVWVAYKAGLASSAPPVAEGAAAAVQAESAAAPAVAGAAARAPREAAKGR